MTRCQDRQLYKGELLVRQNGSKWGNADARSIEIQIRKKGPYHLQSPGAEGLRVGLAEAGLTEAVFARQGWTVWCGPHFPGKSRL